MNNKRYYSNYTSTHKKLNHYHLTIQILILHFTQFFQLNKVFRKNHIYMYQFSMVTFVTSKYKNLTCRPILLIVINILVNYIYYTYICIFMFNLRSNTLCDSNNKSNKLKCIGSTQALSSSPLQFGSQFNKTQTFLPNLAAFKN